MLLALSHEVGVPVGPAGVTVQSLGVAHAELVLREGADLGVLSARPRVIALDSAVCVGAERLLLRAATDATLRVRYAGSVLMLGQRSTVAFDAHATHLVSHLTLALVNVSLVLLTVQPVHWLALLYVVNLAVGAVVVRIVVLSNYNRCISNLLPIFVLVGVLVIIDLAIFIIIFVVVAKIESVAILSHLLSLGRAIFFEVILLVLVNVCKQIRRTRMRLPISRVTGWDRNFSIDLGQPEVDCP